MNKNWNGYNMIPTEELNDNLSCLINVIMVTLLISAVVLIIFFYPGVSHASEIDKSKFVDACIGEAEGEPYIGKLAVSCAIRNRGSLIGVYGVNSPRVKLHKYSSKVFVDCVRACEESKYTDNCGFIHGATAWEGVKFKTPYWAVRMQQTAIIGNQRFYRRK